MERRAFLRRLATVPMLGVVTRGDVSDYTDSYSVLEDLAKEVNQTDLTNAGETFTLTNSIRRALQNAEAGIDTAETDRARTIASFKHSVAQLLSIFPGFDSPPEDPQIEREIDAIESALSYYSTLQAYLFNSGELYIDVSNFEADVSDPTGEPTLAGDDLINRVNEDLDLMKAEGGRLQNVERTPVQTLLPDIKRVTRLSEELLDNYETYVSAQHSYSKATVHITEGARLREQGEIDDAETRMLQAEAQHSIEISENNLDYSLDGEVLNLSDYETVLSLTKTGATKMWESCDSPNTKQSRESFAEGLQDIIDARDVFTTP